MDFPDFRGPLISKEDLKGTFVYLDEITIRQRHHIIKPNNDRQQTYTIYLLLMTELHLEELCVCFRISQSGYCTSQKQFISLCIRFPSR